MKKVFISMPMRGRDKADIDYSFEKAKKIAASIIDDEVEFVNTIVEEKPPYNNGHEAAWYLGGAIQKLSGCDYVVGFRESYNYPGCDTERHVAINYGIPYIELQKEWIWSKEEKEKERKKWESECCGTAICNPKE